MRGLSVKNAFGDFHWIPLEIKKFSKVLDNVFILLLLVFEK